MFDANKRLLYTGDCTPEEVALVKGDHTARVMLRHDNIALLEKLKNTCLVSSCLGLRGQQRVSRTRAACQVCV